MCHPAVTYEFLFNLFRAKPGIFVLGAGASSGLVPLGKEILKPAPVDFLRRGSFSVNPERQSLLTERSVNSFLGIDPVNLSRLLYPERILRDPEDLYTASMHPRPLLQRLPDSVVQFRVRHEIAKSAFCRTKSSNYDIFVHFAPSTILNFNLDGLAEAWCAQKHEVLAIHGTISEGFGSPTAAQLIPLSYELPLHFDPDGTVLCVPESEDKLLNQRLARGLNRAFQHLSFVAIIGYTFGWNGRDLDDIVSFRYFCEKVRSFNGPIFVLDPYPEMLAYLLSDNLKSNKVIPVPTYWNALSHVWMRHIFDQSNGPSFNYELWSILDNFGGDILFSRQQSDNR